MTQRQRMIFGIVGVFLALWLIAMFFWVRGVMWKWDPDATFTIRSERYDFEDYEQPKSQIQPKLDIADETLEEAGYTVWVDEDWVENKQGFQHVTSFARGWYPRISGQIRLNIHKGEEGIVRVLDLKIGGKIEQKQEIEKLGRELEQKLLFN